MKTWMIMIVMAVILWIPYATSAEEKRLVAIGDSIPFGYNIEEENLSPPKESFPSIIANERGLEVTNLSIPGLTSKELLQAIKENDIFRESIKDADYVTVYIGGNDLLNVVKKNKGLEGLKVEQVAPVMRGLVDHVHSIILEIDKLTDGKILVYNLYNPYPQAGKQLDVPLTYINQQYASLIQLLDHFSDVQLVDAYHAYQGHPEYILPGDVHPTKQGQRVLARLSLKYIR